MFAKIGENLEFASHRFEQESLGALHQMLSALDDNANAAAWTEIGEVLASHEQSGRFEGPCVMLAAVGRKA